MTYVTFIVPIFNKAKFLPAVLQAIIGQVGEFDREVIAIDDGSTDATPRILERYQAVIPYLSLIRLEDEGPAVAINRAAAQARGDYFKIVDGDDILAPNATALLLESLQKTDAVLAFGDCGEYNSESLPDVTIVAAENRPISMINDPLPFLIRNIALTMSGTMVPANAFRSVGGCDERVFVHDTPLFLRLGLTGKFVHIETNVAFMPRTDPSRWSNRAQGQVFHDINAAVYFMLRDTPALPLKLKNKCMQRTASRAWTWAKRRKGAGFLSVWFILNLIARIPLPAGHAAMVSLTLNAFRNDDLVRVPYPSMLQGHERTVC